MRALVPDRGDPRAYFVPGSATEIGWARIELSAARICGSRLACERLAFTPLRPRDRRVVGRFVNDWSLDCRGRTLMWEYRHP